ARHAAPGSGTDHDDVVTGKGLPGGNDRHGGENRRSAHRFQGGSAAGGPTISGALAEKVGLRPSFPWARSELWLASNAKFSQGPHTNAGSTHSGAGSSRCPLFTLAGDRPCVESPKP